MTADEAAKSQRMAPEKDVLGVLIDTYPQLSRGRWKEMILKRLPEYQGEDFSAEGVASVFYSFRFVPDAFACYPEESEIDLFEVEVTSPMNREKMQAYAKLVTDLHTYGIELNLYTVNQHGHINRVDLIHHYMSWQAERDTRDEHAKD